ncbi:histidinol dehydrogenase [Thermodesulfobacteriota bacterium]
MRSYRYPSASAEKRLRAIAERGVSFRPRDLQVVKRILADVRKEGDDALVRYVNRFDAPSLDRASLKVTETETETALSAVDGEFLETLERAAKNITDFHRRQVPNSWVTTHRKGAVLGQLVRPVDAAGVYVPGGRGGNTPLVSSVLMGCLPAKIAGVPRVVMVTPPRHDGSIHPSILAAAGMAGVDAVYKVGSAWAVAALAYGTETIPRVDVIAGPGNIYVTIAKKLVAGTVGIDMVAGPSEVLVIGDASANPDCVAADLLSQAEHDPMSACIFVTTENRLAARVKKHLAARLARLPRRDIAEQSVKRNSAIFTVPDLDTALEVANRVAPEHLELMVAEPLNWIGKIRHAGAVFLGPYTPEPVGDYIAGPNHVLPTAGTARFASALSVDHFVKKTSLVYYSREVFDEDAPHILRLAEVEGLSAHAESIRSRMKGPLEEGSC